MLIENGWRHFGRCLVAVPNVTQMCFIPNDQKNDAFFTFDIDVTCRVLPSALHSFEASDFQTFMLSRASTMPGQSRARPGQGLACIIRLGYAEKMCFYLLCSGMS